MNLIYHNSGYVRYVIRKYACSTVLPVTRVDIRGVIRVEDDVTAVQTISRCYAIDVYVSHYSSSLLCSVLRMAAESGH